jgi:hypothetical protein
MTVSSVPPRRLVRLQLHRMRDPLDGRAELDAALTPSERGRAARFARPRAGIRRRVAPGRALRRHRIDREIAAAADR